MSVFSFDPNPPRVSSPWPRPASSSAFEPLPVDGSSEAQDARGRLAMCGLKKLPPEPQEGPVEYKLHLLLRPRRAYRAVAATAAGGSQNVGSSHPRFLQKARVVGAATAGQTRQDRCQHLTTQLLWRLRQTTTYHASVSHQDVVVPRLPDDAAILPSMPVSLGKLAPGLEESRGALYEIGVADDGTLVGITKDELEQSLATLRWMAASLGCVSEVLFVATVGEREWPDEEEEESKPAAAAAERRDKLWVAEVYIKPHLSGAAGAAGLSPSSSDDDETETASHGHHHHPRHHPPPPPLTLGSATPDQLRVTLTGPTASGKSTLLGTLSTGALDDGHGKSRLNSLKHRHEMASGMTSTITHELIGYNDEAGIVNYANPNIESWIGTHDYARNGRLVFVSDSAGHPRFRRTTLRGLVGWAPHWTLLCLSAGGASFPAHTELSEAASASDSSPNGAISRTALAKAHLDLCLKLDLPLAIIITKSDLVLSRESLKRTLAPIWTAVKCAGRVPQLLQSKSKAPENVRSVSPLDAEAIERALAPIRQTGDFCAAVPVILASSVSGDGIGLVHALLRALPLPPPPTASDYDAGISLNPDQPETLFHIEGRFDRPASYASTSPGQPVDPGHVVSGHLRFGYLSVGDRVVVGPFSAAAALPEGAGGEGGGVQEEALDEEHGGRVQEKALDEEHAVASSGQQSLLLSSSHPSVAELARLAAKGVAPAASTKGEWHDARVVSIRNLCLPVERLDAGQVGTVGLVLEPAADRATRRPSTTTAAAPVPPALPPSLKPRKGMVLSIPQRHHHMAASGHRQLQAASSVTAFFDDPQVGALARGTAVTFYLASVRAQARVAKVWSATMMGKDDAEKPAGSDETDEEDVFAGSRTLFGGDHQRDDGGSALPGYNVRLELLSEREWMELGSRIVILEGASKGVLLLDGFVGKVVEVAD